MTAEIIMSKNTLEFIQELIDLELGMWEIKRIVDIEKIEENGKKYAYEIDSATNSRTGRCFHQQDNYYIWQMTQFEDCYYGNVLYPCDGKWVLISYNV